MNDFIVYIFKSAIWIFVFYGIYRFFFRNETFFRFNRTFLLVGTIASFILALCRFHYPVEVVNFALPETGNTPVTTLDTAAVSFDRIKFFLSIYMAGALILLLYYGFGLNKIRKLIRKRNASSGEKSGVVYVPGIRSPFSFFGYVFMDPQAELQDIETKLILAHETAHVEQFHWIDILLAQLVCIFQWFNPFAWLYLNAVKQNHEFLADRSVIEKGYPPAVYQAVLINRTFQMPVFTFANSFASINKYKRIEIMKKKISKPAKKSAVLLLLPAFAVFLAAFAQPEYHYSALPSPPETETPVLQDSIRKTKDDSQTSAKITKTKSPKILQKTEVTGQATDTTEWKTLVGKPISITLKDETVKKSGPIVVTGKPITDRQRILKDSLDKANAPLFIVDEEYITCDDVMAITAPKNAPLIIVDGEERTSSISDIKPESIESISILKNNSATSLYGEKGRNGVIIIKRKKLIP